MNKKSSDVEAALINLFRTGNIVNVSQATAQIKTMPALRDCGTVIVKSAILRLEKDGYLKRETDDGGVTRFRWAMPVRFTCQGHQVFDNGESIAAISGTGDVTAEKVCALLNREFSK